MGDPSDMFPDLTPEELDELVAEDPQLAIEYAAMAEELGLLGRPYVDTLHAAQHRFFLDDSLIKVACCSRRSGKSEVDCAWLLEGAEKVPGGLSIYIMLTRNNCRITPWNTFLRMQARHGLNLTTSEADGQLYVLLPNKHRIWLAGCKNSGEVGKFRGGSGELAGGYTRVVIDEAQNYGAFINELVDDAIAPGLMDQGGQLAITGTPSPIPAGFFYEACNNPSPGMSVHRWTWRDNPYLKNPQRWIDAFLAAKGWDRNHPTYLREYEALWIRDTGSLVYPWDRQKNTYVGELPEGKWRYHLGVDLGYNDATALVVVAYQPGSPHLYVVHAEKHFELLPAQVAVLVEKTQRQWGISKTVVDTGGFGQGYYQVMLREYHLPVEPAEKLNKRAYQEIVSGDLKSGLIHVHTMRCSSLLDEWSHLQWNPRTHEEDDAFENHCSDAALYALRSIRTSYVPTKDDTSKPMCAEKREAIRRSVERMKRRQKLRYR